MAAPVGETLYRGLWYEPIFQTELGSVYYYNFEKGLWLRYKYDGAIAENELNLGSVEHAPQSDIEKNVWQENLKRGFVDSFVPQFVLGNSAYGLHPIWRNLTLSDVVEATEGRIILQGDLNNLVDFHYGHPITKIFQEIDPLNPTEITISVPSFDSQHPNQ